MRSYGSGQKGDGDMSVRDIFGEKANYTTQEEISRLVNVNLLGTSNGLQAGVRRMQKYNHGKIVSTASFAGRHAMKEGFAYYGMTKAAVIYLTQAAAYAGADFNINVNSSNESKIRVDVCCTSKG